MPRRTRRLLVLVLPVALVAVVFAAWLLWPRTAITPENAEKIQPGMTLAEVEAVLGGPARDRATGPVGADGGWEEQFRFAAIEHPLTRGTRSKVWRSNACIIRVQLDDRGCVSESDYVTVVPSGLEGPLDRLRRWFGL